MKNEKRERREDFINSISKIKDNKDTRDTKYNFIIKKTNYKDISFIGVLKTLYKTHKINKYQFKESIRRLTNHKQLRENVYSKMHFYLTTLKSSTSKSTMIALNKQDSSKQYKRVAIIKYQNNNYAVTIKKAKFKELYYNKFLNNEYKELMIKAIGKEFKTLMGGLQDEIIIW